MGYITVGSIDDYYKKALEATKAQQTADVNRINTMSEQQKKSVNDIYNAKIDETGSAYEDSYRENAVQKLINEREVAENMANLGLTDSGLNRTQQTAVQLSYANAKGKIDRQKQAAVDALAQSLAAELANIETTRLSSVADIERQYSQNAMTNATNARNADIDYNAKLYEAEQKRIAEVEKASINAFEKMQTNKSTDTSNLYAHLADNSGDKDYAAGMILSYCQKYDIDPKTDPTISAFLKQANLTLDDLMNYSYQGTTVISNADYTSGKMSGTNINWDYKTGGKQKYKIKVEKNTNNWGWGIDKNDVVSIYYPDGSVVAENVRLDSLTNDVAKKLTGITKGNEGKDKEVEIDLSKETFEKNYLVTSMANDYKSKLSYAKSEAKRLGLIK